MASPYEEAAYSSARRRLDPMWERRQNRFDQAMAARGFAPGSEAYRDSARNLEDARSRAYEDAAFGAMRYGAERSDAERAFGENVRRFNTDNAFRNRAFREGQRQFDEQLGEGRRRFDLGFGEGQRQFDEGTRRFDLGFGEGQRQFDTRFAEDQFRNRRDYGEDVRRFDKQFDLQELTTLDNISRAYGDQAYRDAVFNASREDQQLANLMSILGFAPAGGAQPFNMGSAFDNALVGESYQQNWQDRRNRNIVDAIDAASSTDWGDFFRGLF